MVVQLEMILRKYEVDEREEDARKFLPQVEENYVRDLLEDCVSTVQKWQCSVSLTNMNCVNFFCIKALVTWRVSSWSCSTLIN